MYTIDSDVAILAMHYSKRLAINLFVQLGTGRNGKTVDVDSTDWQSELVVALPSLHATSDCDSVSAFSGTGKAGWLSALEKREEYMNAMRLLREILKVWWPTANIYKKTTTATKKKKKKRCSKN